MALWLPDICSVQFLLHHIVTATLSYFICVHGVYHYYAIFFLGIVELSSIPLTIVDIMKQTPSLKGKWPTTTHIARLAFAGTFFLTRILGWTAVSVLFWRQNLVWISEGRAASAPHTGLNMVVVAIFFGSNLFMTGLQYFWFSKIVAMATKKAPDPKDSKTK